MTRVKELVKVLAQLRSGHAREIDDGERTLMRRRGAWTMSWHVRFDQHLNQFGFALTTAVLRPLDLPDFMLMCDACGSKNPQVVLEVMLLCWSVTITTHARETS